MTRLRLTDIVERLGYAYWSGLFRLTLGKDWFAILGRYPQFTSFRLLVRRLTVLTYHITGQTRQGPGRLRSIHVIGDSHARTFQGCTGFTVHYVGPATAYNLIKDNSRTQSKLTILRMLDDIPLGDIILLEFGEIDCRVHVYNKWMSDGQKKSIDEYVADTIKRYSEFIELLHRRRGSDLAVLTVPPAGYQGNYFKYPHYAPPEVRAEIHRRFNEMLNDFCHEHGIKCVDLYGKVVAQDGLIQKAYLQDDIHLNSNVAPIVRSLLANE